MGCDIHCYAEKRVNGQWQSLNTPCEDDGDTWLGNDNRLTGGKDYGLFGLLSGVRREWDVRIIPDADMCVPEDASPEVKDEHHRGHADWHTEGWLNWQTLLDAQQDININVMMGKIEPSAKDGVEELMSGFKTIADHHNLNVREMRIVLWYDN